MIEASECWLKAGWREIISRRKPEHHQQTARVDRSRTEPTGMAKADRESQQRAAAEKGEREADLVNDQVCKPGSAAVIVLGRNRRG